MEVILPVLKKSKNQPVPEQTQSDNNIHAQYRGLISREKLAQSKRNFYAF